MQHLSYCTLLYIFVAQIIWHANGDILWDSSHPAKSSDFNVEGSAHYSGVLQLTTHSGEVGAFWWKKQQQISNGFIAIIDFYVEANNTPPALAAFVIQAHDNSVVAINSSFWGINFENNVAIVFGAQTAFLFSAPTPGRINPGTNGVSYVNTPKSTGGHYQITIQYVNTPPNSPTLTVSFTSGAAQHTFDISHAMNLKNGGSAWVGFTGASGPTFKQFNITSFQFTSAESGDCDSDDSDNRKRDDSDDSDDCTVTNPCASNNCSKNATCVPISLHAKNYTCLCNLGFSGDGFTCTPIPPSVHGLGLATTYQDTSVSIYLNWTITPATTFFPECSVEVSVDNLTYKSLFTSSFYNFTFIVDRIPRTYYFRVSVNRSFRRVFAYVNITTSGCMDGKCDSFLGETCSTCAYDCCTNEEALCQGIDCGHGSCEQGSCICTAPYAGPACNFTTLDFSTSIDTQNATAGIEIDPSTIFNIDFLAISEIDSSGQITRSYPLASPTNATSDPANTNFAFVYILANSAVLNVSYNKYSTGKILTFAKQLISIPPHALKMTVQITNWNFASISHRLHLDLQICQKNSLSTNCGGMGNGAFWSKDVGRYTFYAQFAKNGIVDGAAARVETIYNQTSQLTTLVIPHFLNYAILDPDFSVLVNPNSPKSGKHLNVGVLVGAIAGGSVGLVLIVVAGYFLISRASLQRIKWKMQRDSLTVIHASK